MKRSMQTFWTRVVERRKRVIKRNRQWIKVHILHGPAQ
jgi:hypothetical protein